MKVIFSPARKNVPLSVYSPLSSSQTLGRIIPEYYVSSALLWISYNIITLYSVLSTVLYCTVLVHSPYSRQRSETFFPTSNNIFKSQRLKIRQLSFELSDLLAFIRIWGINNINKHMPVLS